MLSKLIFVYQMLVVFYCVLYWMRIPASKWSELLRLIIDPVLDVVRKVMKRFVPKLVDKKGIDWAPIALIVALWVVGILLGLLHKLPLIGWLF